MVGFRSFLNSGHAPTLYSAFFYFACSCAVWVINGALAPFISEQYNLSPTQKGLMLAAFMGAALRVVCGYISDRLGGVHTLTVVLIMTSITLLMCGMAAGSLVLSTLLFMLCFSALGAGNGALFQLVPLR